MTAPMIRVGIDWDNDGFIAWGTDLYPNRLQWPDDRQFNLYTTGLAGGATLSTLGLPVDSSVHLSYYKSDDVEALPETNAVSDDSLIRKIGLNSTGISNFRFYIGMRRATGVFQAFNSNLLDLTSTVGSVNVVVSMRVKTTQGATTLGVRAFSTPNPTTGLTGSEVLPAIQSTYAVKSTSWTTILVSYSLAGGFVHRMCPILDQVAAWTGTLSVSHIEIGDFGAYVSSSPFPAGYNFPYNRGGAAVGREELTSVLQDLTWRQGIDNPDDRMSSDGTGLIVVDNSSGNYTPGNPPSSTGSLMKPGVLARIEYLKPSTNQWTPLWVGFVETLDFATDSDLSERRTRIGLFSSIFSSGDAAAKHGKPQEGELLVSVSGGAFRTNIELEQLMLRNRVGAAYASLYARTDQSTTDRCLTYPTNSELLSYPSNSYKTTWQQANYMPDDTANAEQTIAEVIRGWVETEQGFLFPTRNGRLLFVGRRAYRVGSIYDGPVTIYGGVGNLNLAGATDITVRYGGRVYNRATLKYKWKQVIGRAELIPEQQDTDEDVDEDGLNVEWPTRRNIGLNNTKGVRRVITQIGVWDTNFDPPQELDQRDTNDVISYDDAEYKYLYGGFPTNLPTLEFEPGNMLVTNIHPSTVNPNPFFSYSVIRQADTPGGAETPATNDGAAALLYEMPRRLWRMHKKNPARLVLRFNNDGTHPSTYTIRPISIRGTVQVIGKEQNISKDNITVSGGNRVPLSYDAGTIMTTNKRDADKLIDFILEDNDSPQQEVVSFSFVIDSTSNPAYNYIEELYPGRALVLEETFSGITDATHVVVGEEYNFSGTTLNVTYYTRRGGKLTIAEMSAKGYN